MARFSDPEAGQHLGTLGRTATKYICMSAQAGAVFLSGGVGQTLDLVQKGCPSRTQNTTHQDLG